MGPTRPQHHGGCKHEAQPRQQRVDRTRPHLSHNFQQWLGHSDMESTMRYLKPSRSQQVRDKVNEIFS
jgi:hypothetical protein